MAGKSHPLVNLAGKPMVAGKPPLEFIWPGSQWWPPAHGWLGSRPLPDLAQEVVLCFPGGLSGDPDSRSWCVWIFLGLWFERLWDLDFKVLIGLGRICFLSSLMCPLCFYFDIHGLVQRPNSLPHLCHHRHHHFVRCSDLTRIGFQRFEIADDMLMAADES